MSPEAINAAKMREPFTPFVIRVGEASYPITRWDAVSVGKRETVVVVNDGLPNESFRFVPNDQITGLEPMEDCDPPIVV
jgi:hypothetical protein